MSEIVLAHGIAGMHGPINKEKGQSARMHHGKCFTYQWPPGYEYQAIPARVAQKEKMRAAIQEANRLYNDPQEQAAAAERREAAPEKDRKTDLRHFLISECYKCIIISPPNTQNLCQE